MFTLPWPCLPGVCRAFPLLKQSRYTPWRCLGERRYSSYIFTSSALDGGEWSVSHPSRALPPGKGPPVTIGQEAGWASEPVLMQRLEEKSFAPAGDRTSIARSSSPYPDTILTEPSGSHFLYYICTIYTAMSRWLSFENKMIRRTGVYG
jgi:hypothetical protein